MLISLDISVYNCLPHATLKALLCRLCLSFVTITLPQTVYVSLHSQAPQQQYTVLSFSKAWPHSPTDLFMCTMVLHCGHTFLRHRANLRYCTVSTPFWTSRKRQSKFDRKTTILRAPSYVITHLPLCTCYGEVYEKIAREENGWLSRGLAVSL